MTQNVENFMKYLCKIIKELNNDEAVMKKVFKDIKFDTNLNIIDTNSDAYEIDNDIIELLKYMHLYNNDWLQGILPYNAACNEYDNQYKDIEENETKARAEEWKSNLKWTPNYEVDYVFFSCCASRDCDFDKNIHWSFSLANLIDSGVITIEEINTLKQKYKIEHS